MCRIKQTYIHPLNVLLLILMLICGNYCTHDIDEKPVGEKLQSDSLLDSIDELMKNPRWNFRRLAHDSIGPQLLFQDSIATLEIYQKLLLQDGFVEALICKYDSLSDDGYQPGYSSFPHIYETRHFNYELLLSQEEILNKAGDKKIELLRIVTRKYEFKYGRYIQPYMTRASGACLTSRILYSVNYQPYLDELKANNKLQLICSFREPIAKIIEHEEDITDITIIYDTINLFGLDYLKSLE